MNKEFFKSKSFKKIRKVFIITITVLAFFTIIIAIIGSIYEKTVKSLIINEINKYLNTEIQVKDVEKDITFSVFRKFPYAS